MAAAHAHPVEKTVSVVDEKDDKTDDNGKAGNILGGHHGPKDNEDAVIGGIGERKIGTAAGGKADGKKACCDRDGARNEIGCAASLQNKVKSDGDRNRCGCNEEIIARTQAIYFDLGAFALIGIAKPGNERPDCHRCSHSEIGDHLSVIGDLPGNDAVKDGKDDDENLPYGIALCAEDERCDADELSYQRKIVLSVPDTKSGNDERE